MTPATRAALGLPPLPPEQAARIEAQQRALAGGRYMRWPTCDELLPDYPPRQPAPANALPGLDVIELPAETATLHWNLAVLRARRQA